SDRFAILLAGYGTSSKNVDSIFKDIREKVLNSIEPKYERIIKFSYNGPDTTYEAKDTYSALPSKGPEALRATILNVLEDCSDATFDLIGHSLGGAVASQYVSTFLNRDDAKRVRHIVTLDSPVNGSSLARLSFIATGLGLTGFPGSPAANFLAARFDGRDIQVPLNVKVAETLRESGRTVIRTISSTDDRFVPHTDAEIQGFQRRLSLGLDVTKCPTSLLDIGIDLLQRDLFDEIAQCVGHDQVLRNKSSLDAIKEALNLSPVANRLDLIFVIDTTGSMADDIAAAKASATSIVNNIQSRVADFRVALVDYKDFPTSPFGGPGDYPARTDLAFTSSKSSIVNAINALTTGGGGDRPESVFTALRHAILDPSVGGWRDGASKQVILIGDAPPHNPEPFTNFRLRDVVNAAESVDPAVIQTIAIGDDSEAQRAFADLATSTGGKPFTAASASDVVAAVTDAIEAATLPPIIAPDPRVSPAPAEFPRAVKGVARDGQDDRDDDDKERPLTEEQKQQRERTNTGGLDDTRTEGNVVGMRCELNAAVPSAITGPVSFNPEAVPYALIATRDGMQQVRLLYDTKTQCGSMRVGDYLEADGEKQHEFLFEAHNVTVTRGGTRVR
ncbi:MAG: VWA domain-containing protein, partial [Actinobacteria bacterium]|nr:VWA domain-containing protein [Actinomycetota bacterium]